MLCPVVFLGRADEAERVAEGCPGGGAETGEGAGYRHLSPRIRPRSRARFVPEIPIRPYPCPIRHISGVFACESS
jgi:hypothetical protein